MEPKEALTALRKGMELNHQRIAELEAERDKLCAEVERLKGPFTCKHDPKDAGGACATCHAEWIERAEKAKLQIHELSETVVKECTRCKDGLLLHTTSEANATTRVRSKPCPCCSRAKEILGREGPAKAKEHLR